MLKTMFLLVAFSLLTVIAVETPLRVCAAEQSSTPAKTAKAKPAKAAPYTGKVAAVDKTAKSVTLAGKKKPRILLITSQTRIFKAGKPAILDDLAVGDEVRGQSHLSAAGKPEAISLYIGPKEAAKAKPKKAKLSPPAAK